MKGINYVLINNLKIKSIIPFNTEQGRLLQNIILDSQFPTSLGTNTVTQYSEEWRSVYSKYSQDNQMALDKHSDILKVEKYPYLPLNTKFTMSDFCNFSNNIQIVKEINDNKTDSILYVCIVMKMRTTTSQFDRDDLFFKFEQYINKEGFLQIRKSLLNPYSFNRNRVYRFE